MKVLIGRSKEDLDILIQALQTKSDELLGKAFGFPKTAIEAFTGKREKLDISALPQETRESDAVLFSSPFLSKDNWREEIKQGQRDADFIKKISPIIYEEMKTVSLNRETDSNENLSIEQSKETKEQQNINESEDVKGHPPIKYIDGRYICPERGWVRPEFSVGPEEYHRNLFIEYERTFGRGLAKDLSHGPLGFPSYMDDPDFEKKFNEEYGQNLKEEYRELSSKSVGYMCNGSKKVCENTIKELKEYRRKHPKMYSDVLDPNVPKKKFQIIEIKNEK